MPDRPLLALPPEKAERRPSKPPQFVPPPALPTRERQSERIGPAFRRLEEVIAAADAGLAVALRDTVDGLEPERTLVFEVIGAAADLARIISRLPGLELQLEDQLPFSADEDFHAAEGDQQEPVSGRLYACIPDITALKQILSLWKKYQAEEPLPYGYARWGDLFGKLRAIRPWGPEERLPAVTRDYLSFAIENGINPIRLEAELWFRPSAEARTAAVEALRQSGANTNIVAQCIIEEIRYHAVLIELSPEEATNLLQPNAAGIAQTNSVMLVRPQSLVEAKIEETDISFEGTDLSAPASPDGAPIRIGLLDGMPLQRHEFLDGRILIDDPDGIEGSCPPASRVHGTAMACLVLNGDLYAPASGPRQIYARPILEFDAAVGEERTPRNSFPLDIVYRAIRRMKEGEAGEAPICPSVVVVNLSLGDENQPFIDRASPWAKLLDFLAFKYRVLFVVSAGNITRPVPTSIPTLTAFEALTADERESEIIRSLFDARGMRTLLSPAEAVNALTVGACHGDTLPRRDRFGAMTFSPYAMDWLPNLSSGMGLGVRRSVKPDMVFDGGREMITAQPSADGIQLFPARSGSPAFGQKVATPDSTGKLNGASNSSGTSNSAALVTHNVSRIIDVLDPSGEADSLNVPEEFLAVTAKALALHSCSWGDAGTRIGEIVGPADPREWRRRRAGVTSGIGCGRPDFDRVVEGAKNRAVMVHWGELAQDQSLIFRMPVPLELNGLKEFRRVTITAAWLSPINVSRAQHRMARFEIDPIDEAKFWMGEGLKDLPVKDALYNGTVTQVCLTGDNVIALADEGGMGFRLTCFAQYDKLEAPIPFGLAVSLELGEGTTVDVYEQVRLILRDRVRAGVEVEVRA